MKNTKNITKKIVNENIIVINDSSWARSEPATISKANILVMAIPNLVEINMFFLNFDVFISN